MAITVLQLALEMTVETIAQRRINAPDVVIPRLFAPESIAHLVEELLIPAQRPKPLGCYFVFGFEIIGSRVSVANVGHLETRNVDLPPKLPVVPGIAHIVSTRILVKVAQAFARRKAAFRFWQQVTASTKRDAPIPRWGGVLAVSYTHLTLPTSDLV